MTPKKNPNADLERKRPLFFLLGVSLTLLGVITVFQWKTTYSIPDVFDSKPSEEFVFDAPPITHQQPKKAVKIETTTPTNELLAIVNNNVEPIKLDELDLLDDGSGLGEILEDIINNDLKMEEEDGVILEFFAVERSATALECDYLTDREERFECLNKFLLRFVHKNTVYPERDRMLGNEETVYVSFVISKAGKVEDLSLKGDFDGLKAEAKRVVESIPQLSPAKHNGKEVRMRMSLPINFRLN